MSTPDPSGGRVPAPTQNENTGSMTNSMQVGIIDTFQMSSGVERPRLIARIASDDELDQARAFFVVPDNFAKAEHVLRSERVVILMGEGCGRSYAGLRLLSDPRYCRVSWLDPDRLMNSVDDGELEPTHGYLWDLGGTGNSEPFTDSAFTHMCGLISSAPGCRLVIVLDDASHVPPGAASVRVDLGSPDPIAIAEGYIARSSPAAPEKALSVLREHLAGLMAVGTSPANAQYAASLALRVTDGQLEPVTAQQEFTEGIDRELAHIMDESWSSMEYTMMCAVALLHDEPFEDVIDAQRELDDKVRTDELPEGKPLRPRRAFAKPNDRLLAAIHATTEDRDNPSHPGLRVQTVRFVRSGWADGVLSRIWQHYHIEHQLLMDWMCNVRMITNHFGSAVRALTSLIRNVPEQDRLKALDRLASNGGTSRWHLAAATLSRLEKIDELRTIAQETLAEWTTGSPHRKCAAAVYHGRQFDATPQLSLDHLTEIARDRSRSVHNVIVGTLLTHLIASDHRDLILRSVVSWLDDKRQLLDQDGLPDVALDLGRYVLRLTKDKQKNELPLDPLAVISDYPVECQQLVRGILSDAEYGPEAIEVMDYYATLYRYFGDDAEYRDDVVRSARLVELLAPGLRWWGCRALRARLRAQHPGSDTQVQRVIRCARRVHRLHVRPRRRT